MSFYTSWGIILDDIIYPDGQTAMKTLGGGGLYASCGMRVWQQDVVASGAVGGDFDPHSLAPLGFDGSGLVVTDLPTPRAWQVLEEDGRRTQVPRVTSEAWFQQLVRIPAAQPISPTLKALHFLGRGDAPEEAFVKALVAAGVVLSAEPLVGDDSTAAEIEAFKGCLPHFEVFSPDEVGAELLVGSGSEKEQLRALAQLGPRLVALRKGKDGALVYERKSDLFLHVPAAAADVVDVTGAGNAFCGGLLIGWLETKDVHQAAAQASVSAAIALEQVGPPLIDKAVMAQAQERAKKVLTLIRNV